MACAAPSPLHWKDLRAIPREIVLEKPGVTPSSDLSCLELGFLGRCYRIDPIAERVVDLELGSDETLPHELQILLICYLIVPNGGDPTGKEISEKELPGGPTFFRGPHELPTYKLAHRYGKDPDGFIAVGRELGGQPVPLGDRAIRFLPFPSIPVTLILWRADEEFDASVSVVFDRSIQRWFELDMVFLLVGEIVRRILNS